MPTALARVLLCAALLTLLAPRARAAERYYRERWALLVGVSKFRSPDIPPLKYCANDVEGVRRVLTERFGYQDDHIVTLTDAQATRDAILRELSDLADRNRVSGEDAVLVYFSGHGQTVRLARGGDMGFLIPHDARIRLNDDTNPADYVRTCIGMDELRRYADPIAARHTLFLVDACYSGLAVEARRGQPRVQPLATVAARRVTQIIVAGSRDEQAMEHPAWQHGAFTYALLEGLQSGASDVSRDGVTTGMELATYLRNRVPHLAPQTPQFAAFGGDGEFLLTPEGRPDSGALESGLRIALTEPADAAGATEELAVRATGGTVVLKGLVLGPRRPEELTVEGKAVALEPAPDRDPGVLYGRDDGEARAFRAEVRIEMGKTRRVELRARDTAGGEAVRRLSLRAEEGDGNPPEVRIAGVSRRDAAGKEIGYREVTRGARSVGIAAKQGGALYVAGFACDDRAVVAVTVDGRPAETWPATQAQLDGLGWASGVAFEGRVDVASTGRTEVVAVATDAAGREARATFSLAPESGPRPEIRILEPEQTRGTRGTGLLLPRGAATVRVSGIARGAARTTGVTVAGAPARLRPATAAEAAANGMRLPATAFASEVPVPDSGSTEALVVEAVDARGARGTRTVLVQRTGGAPVEMRVAAIQPSYRFGESVRFRITADRDCYVYLLHRDPDGAIGLFLPNAVETDPAMRAGETRLFPDPGRENLYDGEYGMKAQAPAGTDTVYCLAVPTPLPPSLLTELTSFDSLGSAMAAVARTRGTGLKIPPKARESDVARAARELGGTWASTQYEVRE